MDLLNELEAVAENKITAKGKQMAAFPTHPRIAHMLLEAREKGEAALAVACDVAALLEERDPASAEAGADLGLRVEMLQRFRNNERVGDKNVVDRIDRLSFSWRKWFGVQGKSRALTQQEIHHHAGALVAAAYPERIAKQQKRGGQLYKIGRAHV